MQAVVQLLDQLKAAWKWALSFRSPEWELKDYPISIRRQYPDPNDPYDNNPRFKQHLFFASIINWNVSGAGDSKEEALQDLASWFASRKARLKDEVKPLPRPGTDVPIQFASQVRMNAHQELAQDFIERVLGFECAFISDESSLWNFHTDATNEALLTKIRDVYGVNVEDIESAKVWEILDRIAEAQ